MGNGWKDYKNFSVSKTSKPPNHPFLLAMSLGTLYAGFRTRTVVPVALVKHYGLDIKVVDPKEEQQKEFAETFPLKKVPAFVGADGYKLVESIAVDLYRKFSSSDILML